MCQDSSVADGICYQSLFADSHAAMALTSVDGQFLTCNEKFEQLSGYNRLNQLSCFDIYLLYIIIDEANEANVANVAIIYN
jgi:PAS domain-containing protein